MTWKELLCCKTSTLRKEATKKIVVHKLNVTQCMAEVVQNISYLYKNIILTKYLKLSTTN